MSGIIDGSLIGHRSSGTDHRALPDVVLLRPFRACDTGDGTWHWALSDIIMFLPFRACGIVIVRGIGRCPMLLYFALSGR